MLWILLTGLTWAADCTEPVDSQELSTLMADALMGFATMDEEGFYASTAEAEAKLPCVEEVFLPPKAAEYHRLLGIRAFYDGDDAGTRVSFRAALSIEPRYVLSGKIAPEGGKLHRAYEDARTAPVRAALRFGVPSGATAYVDGTDSTSRPADVPAILQLEERGAVTWTGYLTPGAPVPDQFMEAVAEADEVVEPLEETSTGSAARDRAREKARAKAKAKEAKATDKGEEIARTPAPREPKVRGGGGGGDTTLWVLAASSAVLTAGLATTSMVSRGSFDNDPSKGKMLVTNGAYFGAITFGVATVSFGGIALMGGGR